MSTEFTATVDAVYAEQLDFHLRQLKKIAGERMIEQTHYGRQVSYEDVKDFVSRMGLDQQLRKHLCDMFGLPSKDTK